MTHSGSRTDLQSGEIRRAVQTGAVPSPYRERIQRLCKPDIRLGLIRGPAAACGVTACSSGRGMLRYAAAAAQAQQPERMRLIGVLMGYSANARKGRPRSQRSGRAPEVRWMEGSNIRIDTRWVPTPDAELMDRFAKVLVELQRDGMLSSNTPTTAAMLQQTRTIPIVIGINVGDIIIEGEDIFGDGLTRGPARGHC